MNTKKVYSVGAVLTILLVYLGTLLGTALLEGVHYAPSSKDTDTLVIHDESNAGKVLLTNVSLNLSGGGVNTDFSGQYIASEFVHGLMAQKREIMGRITLCSHVQILFGIREIIFPSHFFW
ncbi:hypothetical protein GCM10028791_08470 [Echinicola sediminis]